MSRGRANVSQLPSGLWQWRIEAGYDETGKRRKISGVCRTKTEAERMQAKMNLARQESQLAVPKRLTLTAWCEQWLARREGEVAASTLHQYRLYLETYIPAHIGSVQMQALTTAHLRTIDKAMLKRKDAEGQDLPPLTVATRTKLFVILRMVLSAAEGDGIIARGTAPAHRVAAQNSDKERPSSKKAIDPADLDALLPAADAFPLMVIPWLIFGLGLRRGEMLGLRWVDVDWNRQTLSLEQQVHLVGNEAVITAALKNSTSRRQFHLNAEMIEVLREHQARQNSWRDLAQEDWQETGLIVTTQIGTGVAPRNVNRILEQMSKAAGIRKISSHVGRHTNITGQIRAGVPIDVVAARAGHKNSTVTIRSYRRVLDDELRAGSFSIRAFRASAQKGDADPD
ncbi:site-specific integrase [Deinococcus sp. KNUC1210]|uniref:tyrosine-type recombinase/integrase n=1 Tax=Deinococcus sp. KNUC1210 TaxID=2917691 RepID=UPI001EF004C0|nr:site-specific integrase [Deinococcus sp. KNUC1210]ULH15481.1 site-specific integrase [Deinococcus sp. KNUC1210]